LLENKPPRTLVAYRRRFIRIDHTPEDGCIEIPLNAELFRGNTSEYIFHSPA
jgi:hypothetical protein